MKSIFELHARDFNLWVEETKKAIQNRDFENMDWDNLLEEIDDMGKSEKRSLESYLERLIAHILKLQYWESEKERGGFWVGIFLPKTRHRNYKHWKVEIINFRRRITKINQTKSQFQLSLGRTISRSFSGCSRCLEN